MATMVFRLLAGQHIQDDLEAEPVERFDPALGEKRQMLPERTYNAGELVRSEVDLAAKHGRDKFVRVSDPARKEGLRGVRGSRPSAAVRPGDASKKNDNRDAGDEEERFLPEGGEVEYPEEELELSDEEKDFVSQPSLQASRRQPPGGQTPNTKNRAQEAAKPLVNRPGQKEAPPKQPVVPKGQAPAAPAPKPNEGREEGGKNEGGNEDGPHPATANVPHGEAASPPPQAPQPAGTKPAPGPGVKLGGDKPK